MGAWLGLCYAIVLRRCDRFACGMQGRCDTGASWVLRVERVVELEAAEGPRPFFSFCATIVGITTGTASQI